MTQVKLCSLFDIINGVPSSNVKFCDQKTNNSVKYARPSNSYKGTFAGYIYINEKNKNKLFPAETIFVSTDGQGSHSYSYVSTEEFIPNSNVAVLIPKKEMGIKTKLFYSKCITLNRYKFSYGRKPKGDRLEAITLPSLDDLPLWVKGKLENQEHIKDSANHHSYSLLMNNWKWFVYNKLFKIERGRGSRKDELVEKGKTLFVSASIENNGVTGYTNNKAMHKPNVITVVRNGNSVASAFFQEKPFCSTEDVHVFTPKFKINKYIALFLCTLIRLEKYRFSYGRKWSIERMKESRIKLPVESTSEPDWKFMEDYIKSLPYSDSL